VHHVGSRCTKIFTVHQIVTPGNIFTTNQCSVGPQGVYKFYSLSTIVL